MRAQDAAGNIIELVNGQWVPVGSKRPAPAEPRANLVDNPLQGAMIGAGQFFADAGRNVRDLVATARGDAEGQYKIAAERVDADAIRARLSEDAPISSAIGGMLPGLATLPIGGGITLGARGIAAAPIMAGRAGQVATQVGLGAGLGAAGSTDGEIGVDAGIGGALSGAGMLAGNMVSRVRSGMRANAQTMVADDVARELGIASAAGQGGGRMTAGYADNLAAGHRVGMQTTHGQRTGNRTLQNQEASWKLNPVLAAPFQAVEEGNRQTAVRLGLRALGQEGDSITPDVMARAAAKIDDDALELAGRIGTVEVTNLRSELQKIATAAAKEALPEAKVAGLLARFESGAEARAINAVGDRTAGDALTGRQLMTFRSDALGEMQSAYRNGRPGLGRSMGQIIDAIDTEMANSVGRAANGMIDRKAANAFLTDYERFRDGYKVFAALSEGGANQVGELMPGRVAAALRRNDKTGYARNGIRSGDAVGQNPVGDFYDAIRFLNGVGQDTLPMNGSRTAGASLLQGEGLKARALARFVGTPLGQMYMRADPRVAQSWLGTLDGYSKAEASRASTIAGAGAGRSIASFVGL